jgi:hypothetical protein
MNFTFCNPIRRIRCACDAVALQKVKFIPTPNDIIVL